MHTTGRTSERPEINDMKPRSGYSCAPWKVTVYFFWKMMTRWETLLSLILFLYFSLSVPGAWRRGTSWRPVDRRQHWGDREAKQLNTHTLWGFDILALEYYTLFCKKKAKTCPRHAHVNCQISIFTCENPPKNYFFYPAETNNILALKLYTL